MAEEFIPPLILQLLQVANVALNILFAPLRLIQAAYYVHGMFKPRTPTVIVIPVGGLTYRDRRRLTKILKKYSTRVVYLGAWGSQ